MTRPFVDATAKAWDIVTSHNGTALDAVELGCNVCEVEKE